MSQTLREDPFRGLSGIGSIDPLPANLSFSVPNTNDSDILKVPDFVKTVVYWLFHSSLENS